MIEPARRASSSGALSRMERDALARLGADAREPAQLVDQALDRTFVVAILLLAARPFFHYLRAQLRHEERRGVGKQRHVGGVEDLPRQVDRFEVVVGWRLFDGRLVVARSTGFVERDDLIALRLRAPAVPEGAAGAGAAGAGVGVVVGVVVGAPAWGADTSSALKSCSSSLKRTRRRDDR